MTEASAHIPRSKINIGNREGRLGNAVPLQGYHCNFKHRREHRRNQGLERPWSKMEVPMPLTMRPKRKMAASSREGVGGFHAAQAAGRAVEPSRSHGSSA